VRPLLHQLRRDETGTTTLEFTIVALLFFLLTFGLVEFGNMFWQYNSAAKAAQLGARLAAVSNPVWNGLTTLTDDGTPGGAWTTAYDITCTSSSVDGADGECDGDEDQYDAAAMQCLVFGRSAATPPCDNACDPTGIDDDEAGMCDRYDAITPENVSITYSHTGLGFAGRPGGPVPTITLQLTDLEVPLFVVGDLLGLGPVTLPPFTVTMTGEDLSRLAP
jgi:hypothetical protein